MNGTHRASVSASTAVNAGIRVDGVNVTLVDSALRALACTCSASYAISFRNLVSHNSINKIVTFQLSFTSFRSTGNILQI